MKMLIFVPPSHFKDDSLKMTKLFFDKWGVDYDVSSYTSHECMGSQGSIQKLDVNTSSASHSNYDGIVLIGGEGIEKYKLHNFRPMLDMLLRFNNSKKHICSIGNSVKLIARSNIIKDKNIVVDSDKESHDLVVLFHGKPSENNFEVSDNIVTISDKDYESLEEGLDEFMSHIGAK